MKQTSFPLRSRKTPVKTPRYGSAFWTMKLLSSLIGTTVAQGLSVDLGLGFVAAMGVAGVVFAVMVTIQLRLRFDVPTVYWMTMGAADVTVVLLDRVMIADLGVSPSITATIFATFTAGILLVWLAVEGTTDVNSISSVPCEAYFWAAAVGMFGVGISAADVLASNAAIDTTPTIVVLAAIIAIVTTAAVIARRYATFWFWTAFVVSCVFGRGLASYLAEPTAEGGADLGIAGTGAMALAVSLCILVVLSLEARDERTRSAVSVGRHPAVRSLPPLPARHGPEQQEGPLPGERPSHLPDADLSTAWHLPPRRTLDDPRAEGTL